MVAQINSQIKSIERWHKREVEKNPMFSRSIYDVQYSDGKFIMPDLLVAKANALNGIAVLEGMTK